jgi:hypothetical protein
MRDDRFSKTSMLLLAGATLIGAAMLLTRYWEAVQRFEVSGLERDPQQCMLIPHGPERLACFEKLLNQPPPQPARGANAPAGLFKE